MTGLDNILKQITEEADSVAQQKIKAARAQAESIREEGRQQAQRQKKAILDKAAADCENYRGKIHSRAEFRKRNALLEARQEIISSVIEKAYDVMCSADEETYFQWMEQLLEKYALPKSGEICFSARDLKRMPLSFKAKIKMTAMKKGGSLKLSSQEARIENGVVLVYGGVEENCTLRAVFEEKKELLCDRVREYLFPR